MVYDTFQLSHRFFSSISNPRVERTQKHSLDAILFISLCAVIC
ncbi:MAG TPA: hypothetical protein DDY12_10755 [Porphyromonadaceae bacterium]|nr:hypothetical protein [Porphyromonadaceae bacterium]